MYRSLLLLIVASASSAPQSSKESDITYVKIQPITEQLAPAKTPYRESRIENLHLTVPNVGAKRFSRRQFKNRNDDSKEVFINKSLNTRLVNSTKEILVNEKSFNPPLKSVEVFGGTDRKTVEVKPKVNSIKETKYIINAKTLEDVVPEELLGKNLNDKDFKANSFDDEKGIESNLSKRSPDTTPDPDPKEIGLPESRPTETPELPKLEEDSIRKEDDSVRKEEDSVKKDEDSVRNEEIQTTTFDNISDTTEASDITEKNKYLEEIIKETEEYEARTRAPTPRFLSKLSYFSKNEEEALVTNFIDRSSLSGYRRFKSKCRCEKIWNCPKLQITVPRCPNEYYLCCF